MCKNLGIKIKPSTLYDCNENEICVVNSGVADERERECVLESEGMAENISLNNAALDRSNGHKTSPCAFLKNRSEIVCKKVAKRGEMSVVR